MPFYDKPFDLKRDKRRKINLVDDNIDLEYDVIDDLKPIWVLNKKVPFKSVLKDLKAWQDRYAFRKFYNGLVRPLRLAGDMAIAVNPKYALRFCQGRTRTGDNQYMCFAANKNCTVLLYLVDDQTFIDQLGDDAPFAITKDASMRSMISRMSVRQFINKFGSQFQFFIVYN